MLRVAMLPQTRPGQITLQATAVTWKAAALQLKRGDNTAQNMGRRIERMTFTDDVVRLTFPEKEARMILQGLGLSA